MFGVVRGLASGGQQNLPPVAAPPSRRATAALFAVAKYGQPRDRPARQRRILVGLGAQVHGKVTGQPIDGPQEVMASELATAIERFAAGVVGPEELVALGTPICRRYADRLVDPGGVDDVVQESLIELVEKALTGFVSRAPPRFGCG